MDESDLPPAEPRSSKEVAVGKTQVLGLDYNLAGLLCYVPAFLIDLIFPLIWLNSEPKDNKFLRFHAMQGLLLVGAYVGIAIVLTIVSTFLAMIPIIGMIAPLLGLVQLGTTVYFIYKSVMAMIDAYKGNMTKIEYIGEMAEQKINS